MAAHAENLHPMPDHPFRPVGGLSLGSGPSHSDTVQYGYGSAEGNSAIAEQYTLPGPTSASFQNQHHSYESRHAGYRSPNSTPLSGSNVGPPYLPGGLGLSSNAPTQAADGGPISMETLLEQDLERIRQEKRRALASARSSSEEAARRYFMTEYQTLIGEESSLKEMIEAGFRQQHASSSTHSETQSPRGPVPQPPPPPPPPSELNTVQSESRSHHPDQYKPSGDTPVQKSVMTLEASDSFTSPSSDCSDVTTFVESSINAPCDSQAGTGTPAQLLLEKQAAGDVGAAKDTRGADSMGNAAPNGGRMTNGAQHRPSTRQPPSSESENHGEGTSPDASGTSRSGPPDKPVDESTQKKTEHVHDGDLERPDSAEGSRSSKPGDSHAKPTQAKESNENSHELTQPHGTQSLEKVDPSNVNPNIVVISARNALRGCNSEIKQVSTDTSAATTKSRMSTPSGKADGGSTSPPNEQDAKRTLAAGAGADELSRASKECIVDTNEERENAVKAKSSKDRKDVNQIDKHQGDDSGENEEFHDCVSEGTNSDRDGEQEACDSSSTALTNRKRRKNEASRRKYNEKKKRKGSEQVLMANGHEEKLTATQDSGSVSAADQDEPTGHNNQCKQTDQKGKATLLAQATGEDASAQEAQGKSPAENSTELSTSPSASGDGESSYASKAAAPVSFSIMHACHAADGFAEWCSSSKSFASLLIAFPFNAYCCTSQPCM